MPGYHVYLLRCADNTLYCGVTTDLVRRVTEHNNKIGSRYTRSRLPVRLLGSTPAKDRSAAQKLEAAVKKLSRAEKLQLLANWERAAE